MVEWQLAGGKLKCDTVHHKSHLHCLALESEPWQYADGEQPLSFAVNIAKFLFFC